MVKNLTYQIVDMRIRATGMFCRGGFHPKPNDKIPISGQTCIMVGNAGRQFWSEFETGKSDEVNPLEHWTSSVLGVAAEEFGAEALFPFTGPPYLPFLTWAQRSELVFPSPIGLLIHPQFGLWHAYRGMLVFNDLIKLPPKISSTHHPCKTCDDKPCTTTCPVDALRDGGLRPKVCTGHIRSQFGRNCMEEGCLARRACPIGRTYIYQPNQARFHMASFLETFGETCNSN